MNRLTLGKLSCPNFRNLSAVVICLVASQNCQIQITVLLHLSDSNLILCHWVDREAMLHDAVLACSVTIMTENKPTALRFVSC